MRKPTCKEIKQYVSVIGKSNINLWQYARSTYAAIMGFGCGSLMEKLERQRKAKEEFDRASNEEKAELFHKINKYL